MLNKSAKTKLYIGILILVILTASIYILLPEKVKISVENTRTKFFVWEEGSWVHSATEYTQLWDGTAKMRAKSRLVEYATVDDVTTITRVANYKDNITTINSYDFDSTIDAVELIPLKHTTTCVNCEGKILQFEYRNILYTGETRLATSPESFGHNMKVEWQEGNYYAKFFQQKYASDKLIIKYKPESDYETYEVRMFDPPQYSPINPSFEIASPFSWTGTGGVGDRQNVTVHTGSWASRILQTGGSTTLLYQNLSSITLTNAINYTASAWIYIPSGQAGENMHGELAMGSGIGSQAARRVYGSINTTNTTDTWMQINLTFIYNSSTELYFDMFADGSVAGGGYVYWDDAYIFNTTTSNVSNTAPVFDSIKLNATSISNYTTDNLTCYVNGTDTDGDNITAYYLWYVNNTIDNSLNGSYNYVNATLAIVSTLDSGNTSVGDNWTCSIRLEDGTVNETSWHNSSDIEIQSSLTTVPSAQEFDLVFIAPWNGSFQIVYSLGFETNASSQLATEQTALSTALSINASVGGRQAPMVLSKYDNENNIVKSFFGAVSLPSIYSRNYSMMFMLNVSAGVDQLVSIPINLSLKMEAYVYNWTAYEELYNKSLLLTAGTIYGGTIDYNSSQTEIPYYISTYSG